MITNVKLLEMLDEVERCCFNVEPVNEMRKALIDNIREENAKNNGVKNKLAIIKRILKTSSKIPNADMVRIHPQNISDNIINFFTDGTYVLGSEQDFGYDVAVNPIKFNVFSNIPSDHKITLNRTDIATHAKTQTKKNFIPYTIKYQDFIIAFDAKKMLDCMDFTGCHEIAFDKKLNHDGVCLINPIIIANDKDKAYALLLPCNIKDTSNITVNYTV